MKAPKKRLRTSTSPLRDVEINANGSDGGGFKQFFEKVSGQCKALDEEVITDADSKNGNGIGCGSGSGHERIASKDIN